MATIFSKLNVVVHLLIIFTLVGQLKSTWGEPTPTPRLGAGAELINEKNEAKNGTDKSASDFDYIGVYIAIPVSAFLCVGCMALFSYLKCEKRHPGAGTDAHTLIFDEDHASVTKSMKSIRDLMSSSTIQSASSGSSGP